MPAEKYNAVEVIEMARDIEKRGRDFYINQAEKTENREMEKLFKSLAADEEDHYQRFCELGDKIKASVKNRAGYVYDREVSAYLEAVVEFSVFPPEGTVQFESIEKVLQTAIYAEKDSILLYQEMLEHNQGETANILQKLIKEEKKHLLDLIKYDAERTAGKE